MNTKALSLLLLVLLFSAGLAEEPAETASKHLEAARRTGSHLALKEAQLLNTRHNLSLNFSGIRLSRYGLASDIFGGFAVFEGAYRGNLDLFTGQRAIDESLQLDTIRAQDSRSEPKDATIESITNLAIESHPWGNMIEELAKPAESSPILNLVPHDHLLIQFKDGETIGELDSTLRELSAGLNHLFDLDQTLQVRQMVAERLGLEALLKHQAKLGEFAFVSEDLDFFPSTHYAVIFSLEKRSQPPGLSVLDGPKRGQVGAYFVVASSTELFERIKKVGQGKLPSMGASLDYQYANAVIDRPRDGLAYLSEAFILKLVSPEYRINSSRRLQAIDTLVDAQYTVWAYRGVTGNWPKTFAQIVEEGYLSIGNLDTHLRIEPNGDVTDRVWGPLHAIKPLSDVPITKVSGNEAKAYDRFRERYQQYWSKYFDPIGIGFRLDENLTFHTIILPLIENSDYRQLTLIAGGDPVAFDGVFPSSVSNVSFHSRFNFEGLLPLFFGSARTSTEPDTLKQQQDELNTRFNERAGLNPPVDLFTMFGDEVAFLVATDALSSDIEMEKTLCVGIEIANSQDFRRATEAIFSEIGDLRSFKKYKEYEYIEFPFWGSTHLFAAYQGRFLYLSLGEQVIHYLLDHQSDGETQFLGQNEIGQKHNLVWRGDFSKSGLLEMTYQQWLARSNVDRQFLDAVGYLTDQDRLDALLPSNQASQLLSSGPEKLHGVPLARTAQGPTIGGYPLQRISFLGLPQESSDATSVVKISGLVQSHRTQKDRDALARFQWLTIGLDFTPEGLSTRVVVNRPSARDTWFQR